MSNTRKIQVPINDRVTDEWLMKRTKAVLIRDTQMLASQQASLLTELAKYEVDLEARDEEIRQLKAKNREFVEGIKDFVRMLGAIGRVVAPEYPYMPYLLQRVIAGDVEAINVLKRCDALSQSSQANTLGEE